VGLFGTGVALKIGIHLADVTQSGSLAFVVMTGRKYAAKGH